MTLFAGNRAMAGSMTNGMPGMSGMMAAPSKMSMADKLPILPEGAPLRDLPRLANRSVEPGLFEATLTAKPGQTQFARGLNTPNLAYNGESPGPLIEVVEGDRVKITFANRIPGQESTIHWHGIPTPADQDGSSMDPVATGTDRTYAFDLPQGECGFLLVSSAPGRQDSRAGLSRTGGSVHR